MVAGIWRTHVASSNVFVKLAAQHTSFEKPIRLRRSDVQESSVSQDELLQTTISMHVHKYCAVRRPPLKRKKPSTCLASQTDHLSREGKYATALDLSATTKQDNNHGWHTRLVELAYTSVLHCAQPLADLLARMINTSE